MDTITVGVIFAFYAVNQPVAGVVSVEPDALTDGALQIDDISINSRAMSDLTAWLIGTALKHLVEDPESRSQAVVVGKDSVSAIVSAHSPADDPEDVVTSFVDALERSADDAQWRGCSLGIVIA